MMWKKRSDPLQETTLEEFRTFISGMKSFTDNPVQFNLVGGEPLVRNDLHLIIGHISDNGFSSSITTNGCFLDENRVKELASSGLSSIFLSLDTLDSTKHDFLRGASGAWNKVMRGLENLQKYSPDMHLGINTVVSGQNMDDLIQLVEWVEKDDRIDCIYLMAVMQPYETAPEQRWYETEEHGFLWPKDPSSVREVMSELIRRKKKGSKIMNAASQIRVFEAYFSDPSRFIKKAECNLGYSGIFVNVEGDMYLCFDYEPIGNIKKCSIAEAWTSGVAGAVRKKIGECHKNCELLINCHYEEEA